MSFKKTNPQAERAKREAEAMKDLAFRKSAGTRITAPRLPPERVSYNGKLI